MKKTKNNNPKKNYEKDYKKSKKNSRRKSNKRLREKSNQTVSQRIKSKARKSLNKKVEKRKKRYVVDTSAVINKFLPKLINEGLQGKLIIPDAVIAELENLANKGREAGYIGLNEIAKLHKLKKQSKIKVEFTGPRPDEKQIKYAKAGEIDALIRKIAFKNHATLITADLVQAKSAQAYGLNVIFLRPPKPKIKKRSKGLFSFFKRRKSN